MDPYKRAADRRRRIENAYLRSLKKIIRDLKELLRNETDPNRVARKIDAYAATGGFDAYARAAAQKMVTGTLVGQKATWREAAAQSMHGAEIYQALRNETAGTALGRAMDKIIKDNAKLIKTCPRRIARQMSEYARKAYMEGQRFEETMENMRRMAPHLLDYQLRRIARTEASKAATALLQARAEALGIEWYIWRTSHDERVRSSHGAMDGIYCRWSDPPNPEALFPFDDSHDSGAGYHPGNIYNCRCIALPVVDDRDVSFPARCHVNGDIVTVGNINKFKQL